jgi:surface antigen
MSSLTKLLLPLALALVTTAAQAQMFGPSWETYVTLTQADMDLIKGAVTQRVHGNQLGTIVSWRNPASGNYGTVRLLNVFTREGRRCEEIEYVLRPPQQAMPGDRFVFNSCVQPDGTWKLAT